jgi:hypothetical protein
MAAGQGSTPKEDWELKVIDVAAEAEKAWNDDPRTLPKGRLMEPDTSRAQYYANYVAVPKSKRGTASTPDLFEKYRSVCLNEDGITPIWTVNEIKKDNFIPKETTHIIELYDAADKQLKTFAFLHAPANPKAGAHAKCVLLCGSWKSSTVGREGEKGWEWMGGPQIVHAERERIAKQNGYTEMDLTAGNKKLATKVWGSKKFGFKELPNQEGKEKDIEMTKTLTGGRRKSRKRITRKRRTRRNVA